MFLSNVGMFMLSLMFVIVFVPFVLSGSEPVQILKYFFIVFYICIAVGDQIIKSGGCDPIKRLNHTTILYLS
jgi:hypothetical protein